MASTKYIIIAVSSCILSILTSFSGNLALAQGRGYDSCPWGWGGGMMGGWGTGWFGMIFMTAFWILLIVALVVLIRWLFLSSRRHPSGGERNVSDPLDILNERYARGEIDQEEYQQKRLDLRKS